MELNKAGRFDNQINNRNKVNLPLLMITSFIYGIVLFYISLIILILIIGIQN